MESEKNEMIDIETAIDYAQLAFHTLINSATEISAKEIKKEILMLHNKFGTKEVKRLNKIISKGK